MTNGVEVLNGAGRTVFNTEQLNPNYYSSVGPVSATGYGVNPSYTIGSNTVLLGRPLDNQSGVIMYNITQGRFSGHQNTSEQSFGAANGVKYIKFDSQRAIARAGSGTAIEVLNLVNEILFTSNIVHGLNIISVGSLSGTSDVVFTCPSGVNFNNVYVTPTSFTGEVTFSAGGEFVPSFNLFFGSFAYFNNTAKTITMRSAFMLSAGGLTWDSSTSYYGGINARKDYLIVEVKS